MSYHDETAYARDRLGGEGLDWANAPDPFKVYPDARPITLPRDVRFPAVDPDAAARRLPAPLSAFGAPDLGVALALCAGVTGVARRGGGEFVQRAAPSAGGLYPIEVYAATRGVSGIPDGLHHYRPRRHEIEPLRPGDPFGGEAGDGPALTFYLTSVFFRTAWKYRARAYRYVLLDCGHVAENLALALSALGAPFEVRHDFDDGAANAFLGLDGRREACLAVLRCFGAPDVPGSFEPLPASFAGASRSAAHEVEYPAILDAHGAGAVVFPPNDGGAPMRALVGLPQGPATALRAGAWPGATLPEAVFRRRSSRRFAPAALSGERLGALLSPLFHDLSDARPGLPDAALAVALACENVEGVLCGLHVLDRGAGGLAPVREGALGADLAVACLDQTWMAGAAIHAIFCANMPDLYARFGFRGYRYAMIEAGRMAERVYLAATANGCGACGVGALYDGEAAGLLGLNPASRVLYCVSAGVLPAA